MKELGMIDINEDYHKELRNKQIIKKSTVRVQEKGYDEAINKISNTNIANNNEFWQDTFQKIDTEKRETIKKNSIKSKKVGNSSNLMLKYNNEKFIQNEKYKTIHPLLKKSGINFLPFSKQLFSVAKQSSRPVIIFVVDLQSYESIHFFIHLCKDALNQHIRSKIDEVIKNKERFSNLNINNNNNIDSNEIKSQLPAKDDENKHTDVDNEVQDLTKDINQNQLISQIDVNEIPSIIESFNRFKYQDHNDQITMDNNIFLKQNCNSKFNTKEISSPTLIMSDHKLKPQQIQEGIKFEFDKGLLGFQNIMETLDKDARTSRLIMFNLNDRKVLTNDDQKFILFEKVPSRGEKNQFKIKNKTKIKSQDFLIIPKLKLGYQMLAYLNHDITKDKINGNALQFKSIQPSIVQNFTAIVQNKLMEVTANEGQFKLDKDKNIYNQLYGYKFLFQQSQQNPTRKQKVKQIFDQSLNFFIRSGIQDIIYGGVFKKIKLNQYPEFIKPMKSQAYFIKQLSYLQFLFFDFKNLSIAEINNHLNFNHNKSDQCKLWMDKMYKQIMNFYAQHENEFDLKSKNRSKFKCNAFTSCLTNFNDDQHYCYRYLITEKEFNWTKTIAEEDKKQILQQFQFQQSQNKFSNEDYFMIKPKDSLQLDQIQYEKLEQIYILENIPVSFLLEENANSQEEKMILFEKTNVYDAVLNIRNFLKQIRPQVQNDKRVFLNENLQMLDSLINMYKVRMISDILEIVINLYDYLWERFVIGDENKIMQIVHQLNNRLCIDDIRDYQLLVKSTIQMFKSFGSFEYLNNLHLLLKYKLKDQFYDIAYIDQVRDDQSESTISIELENLNELRRLGIMVDQCWKRMQRVQECIKEEIDNGNVLHQISIATIMIKFLSKPQELREIREQNDAMRIWLKYSANSNDNKQVFQSSIQEEFKDQFGKKGLYENFSYVNILQHKQSVNIMTNDVICVEDGSKDYIKQYMSEI